MRRRPDYFSLRRRPTAEQVGSSLPRRRRPPRILKPHKDRVRPTRVDYWRRVRFCIRQLSLGYDPAEIKDQCIAVVRETEGIDISRKTVDGYLRRARGFLLAKINKPRAYHIADAVGFYTSIVQDTKLDHALRMKAQDLKVKLLVPISVNVNAQGTIKHEHEHEHDHQHHLTIEHRVVEELRTTEPATRAAVLDFARRIGAPTGNGAD